MLTTNGFALNHDKSLQIYLCVKHQAKNIFLKAVEREVAYCNHHVGEDGAGCYAFLWSVACILSVLVCLLCLLCHR